VTPTQAWVLIAAAIATAVATLARVVFDWRRDNRERKRPACDAGRPCSGTDHMFACGEADARDPE
jgi:hypothetical protein